MCLGDFDQNTGAVLRSGMDLQGDTVMKLQSAVYVV